MNRIIIFVFLLVSNIIFCQSNFNNGFNDGYKKGYCQDKGIGCLPPLPPLAPIPEIGENSNSYQDGYNRGFKMGLQVNSENNNSSSNRERYKTSSAQFVDDFIYNPYKDPNVLNLAIKVAELKAQKLNSLFSKATESYNGDDYGNAIYYANEIIKIDANISQSYAIKAMSYFYKNEILNAYNNICKAESLNYSGEDNVKFLKEETSKFLKQRISNEDYESVRYFCENVWYPNNFTNYYLGVSYYHQNDYKNAKKILKKTKNFEPAKKLLTFIESGTKNSTNSEKTNMPNISSFIKTKSGLKYIITKSTKGEKLENDKKVLVNYKIYLTNGKVVIDSFNGKADALNLTAGKNITIQGIEEALLLLKEGERATLFIPSELAYGQRGVGDIIPPNSDLYAEIEIVKIIK